MSQSDDCYKAKRAKYTDLLEMIPDHMEPDLPEAQGIRKEAQYSVRGQRGHIPVMICSVFILF
jgi:hypothetical protein